jgi:murein DD-endopeptidase MepM/ murein hydrolase activator NlpD
MTSEQPPRDALRPYRPLPSIDIPLLREERSAVRSRRLVRVAISAMLVAAAAASIALGIHYVSRPSSAPQDPSEPALSPEESQGAIALPEPSAAVEPEPVQPEVALPLPAEQAALPVPKPSQPTTDGAAKSASRTQYTFGKALSFRDALEHNGLSHDEANALIEVLDAPMDFRHSQPEDVFAVERDSTGKLVRFEYKSGLTLRYEAARDGQGKLKARQIPVPIRVVRVSKGGVVSGSLGDALEGLQLGRSLAGLFTEVFEGRIDFSTDTRAGDSFRIILEQEYVDDTFLRYGAVDALEYKGVKAGTQRAFYFASGDDEGDFYDENGRALHGGWLRTPLRYDHISSAFGMRQHPVLKRKLLHNGIDYAAGSGTPVRAAADGVVTWSAAKGANGNLLMLQHNQGYETCYAHLLRYATGIKKGSKVKQRQVVAYVGSTGRSTGPHLHFSLKKNGRFVDPASQLNGPGLPMPAKDLAEHKRRVRELSAALARVPIEQPAPVSTPSTHSGGDDTGEEEDL